MSDIYARDIEDCNDCPLKGKDCKGIVGTPSGYLEPPCTSWDDDDLIYEGMYEGGDV